MGQLGQVINHHEYLPTEWTAGKVVQGYVQIIAATLYSGSYAV